MEEQKQMTLPENAFRELNEGESYEPIMSANKSYREVTPWSITWGIVMAIIFSAATAYLGLKVGQVFEAAIPITIIAIGLSGAAKRKDPLGENVIIQSVGACSGMVVAGAIFTLPALYILQSKYPDITVNFFEVFMASLLGGVLGILFLIPFRKYFVKDMHGKYPFPEATASTQVLISGEKGGNQAKPLLVAGIIGGLYDFLVASFGTWTENFTSRVVGLGCTIADKTKLLFSINTSAALLGMGYIVGLKYACIICFGSVLVWWVIVPLIAVIFPELEVTTSGVLAANASPEQIFAYAKSIGIGGIATAGIIGIIKSWGVIRDAFKLFGQIFGKSSQANTATVSIERTQRDLSMKIIVFGTLLAILATTIFFFIGPMDGNLLFTIVGILIVAIIAFLFTTVAANAIAIVGSNPVSGMTLMTLILSSIIMVLVGLQGTHGMVAALIMGGVVCTALSSAGSFITDLKIGYWLGSTPKYQETWKFIGILVSAATVGGVIMILNKAYGFTPDNSDVMAAPQARAMAAVIEPLMSGQGAPWMLYGIGAVIAIVLNFCGISPLAFALGMFIPLQLNLPLIVGGLISWYVAKPKTNGATPNNEASEKGTLLASGFIAGGALMGVVSAGLRFAGCDFVCAEWLSSSWAEGLSLVAYILLIIYFVKACRS
ncbi:MAG: oligopeptide transporter, OPT family [Prevotellaceae bacterium]|nr:oligopeptide transporter, OPT family [Candidatus Colivivens equi]